MEALTISDIAPDGRGVAYWGDKPVFIPNTIPGEVVQVTILDETDNSIDAMVEQFVDVSADRVEPKDEGCGAGHSWQHIAYDAQLALKTDIVGTYLELVGKLKDPPLEYTLASPEQWGYARLMTFAPDADGMLGVRWNKTIKPINDCAIAHPLIMDIIQELNLSLDTINRIDVHANDVGDSMLVLQTTDEEPPELEINLPAASINFLLNDNEPANLVGDTHILQRVGDYTMRITAGVTARPNVPQWDALGKTVLQAANPQETDSILDVFGGTGLFSLYLASHVSYITYIDRYPPAATDAEFNLAEFDHVDIIEGRAEMILEDIAGERDREDYATMILDPTKGLSDKVLATIRKLKIPRIIYVSSNVEFMARDINILSYQMNYTLTGVQPIDTDPQTPNLTCVCVLERH